MKYILRAIVKYSILIYCKIVYRVKVIGKENIPKKGPIILCGNHKSFLDAPLMVCTTKRFTHFLAKEELAKHKFLAALGALYEVIYVKQGAAKDMGSVKTTMKYLKNGEGVALFPEGTRNGIAKGEKVRNGVSYFVLNSDATVIPFGIKGGEKPFKKAYITYGKPMDFTEEKKDRKNKEVIEKVTNDIMTEILELAK